MQRPSRIVLLLLLPLLASGCMTHRLWTESGLDDWNGPAPAPNLRLFEDQRHHDLLVVYDEYSERKCITRPRAYFLYRNQDLLVQHKCPHFVKTGVATKMPAVPLFHSLPGSTYEGACAVAETNSPNFIVLLNGHELGSNELPVYNDGIGQTERLALTPVATTIDLTIIGGVLGYYWLYMDAPGWNYQ